MLILLRMSSEISLKSVPVRKRFQSRLISNIREAMKLNGLSGKVVNKWSRIYVELPEDNKKILDILKRVPGLSSFSPVELITSLEMDEIIEKGVEKYTEKVKDKKFCVRVNRATKISYTSKDLEFQLGGNLKVHSAGVSLSNPEFTLKIELRECGAYFYSQQFQGAGGLPTGTAGRTLTLISGGFDSAVAAWMMLKRGVNTDYLFCNLAGKAYERSVLTVAKHMANNHSYGIRPRIHILDFEKVVENLKESVEMRFSQVILKRLMYVAAQKVAKELEAEALITGEALAQVSSQTLTNIATIQDSIEMPVLRPLIGFDKQDIIDISRKIGTYTLCAPIQEYCALVPKKPATAAKLGKVKAEEEKLNKELLEQSVQERRVINLLELNLDDLMVEHIFTAEVKTEDSVIDMRPSDEFNMSHHPQAISMPGEELFLTYKKMDKSKRYILMCDIGLESAVIAEKLQAEGFEAYSFKGGWGEMRKSL